MDDKTIAGITIALILGIVAVMVTPIGRAIWNRNQYAVQKVDDATSYRTRKQVEDTCRALIASYTADKLRYEQYAGSDSTEQRSWGEQAKMRANATAAQYNEYVLKNSFIFDGNVPKDIREKLEYIT